MADGMGALTAGSWLQLLFNATAFASPSVAQNEGTSPITNLYVSLHTADPTTTGNQSSSEISYTGYSRVAVARTTSGWTVTANAVSPVATIIFNASTGGTGGTVTNWAVGSTTLAGGAGQIFYVGTVSPNIVVTSGVTPELTTASTITQT